MTSRYRQGIDYDQGGERLYSHADICPGKPDCVHEEEEGMTPETIAENAIGLFLEYRDKHGNTEEMAQMNACREVVEGTEDFVVVARALIAALTEALDDCLSLAVGWAGYYSISEAYGQNGIIHSTHQAIIDKARAALALSKDHK